MTTPPTILIVDDEPQNCRLLQALLGPEKYQTRTASGGVEALAYIDDNPPDLILLDVMMPGLDGREVASAIKSDPATCNIPIIMVTAQTDREARLAALEAGAEDFLSKPIDRAELWLRVRNLLRLKMLGDLLENHQATLEAEVLARTEDLQHLANHDPLTGLPNRTMVYETLTKALLHAPALGQGIAVLFLDLDNFKAVNDTLGHAIGDELLVEVSDRLIQCVRIRDVVGRLGGDEFALILMMQDGRRDAAHVAEKIQRALQEPFHLDGHTVAITASIGITLNPDDANDAETLIKYADTAMYQAKHAGRDAFRFFTSEMNLEVLLRGELNTALRLAVENQEFVLRYEPKVQLNGGYVVGLEAQLLWDRPGHGLVPASAFLHALEDSGLIVDVGRWVIFSVCDQIRDWLRRGVNPVQVSVNISEKQFVKGDLQGDIVRALEKHGVPAELLELELTESLLQKNTNHTIAILKSLKARGVQISIDEFGTGYSSLAFLRRFPIDKLKIAPSFVRDVTSNPDDAAIVLAIIRMGHSLDQVVIAEGVETAAQLAYLRRHHCDQIQGLHFSGPLPPSELEGMLVAGTSLPAPDSEVAAPRQTILVADDGSHEIDALRLLLGTDDHLVLTAADATECFALLALHEVHVIVCNERIPGEAGTDFTDRVERLSPNTLQIVLSGSPDVETLIAMINRGGVFRYFTKPWNGQELRSSVREGLRVYRHLRETAGLSGTDDLGGKGGLRDTGDPQSLPGQRPASA